jgi:hypothetical protein
MKLKVVGSFLSAALLIGSVSPGTAGGYPAECYERYRTPPTYGTVYENVEINPAYVDVQVSPPIVGTRQTDVLVQSEGVGYHVIPAQYGYTKKRVLLEPARTVTRQLPAKTEKRYRKVQTAAAGYAWEWRVINGRKVLCKVWRKARYKTVVERVAIAPGRVVRETVPAVYGYEKERVLIAPERKEAYVIPARYESETEQVVLRPKLVRKTFVRPSYQTRAREVLVSPGTEGWSRVPVGKRCRG